MTENEVRKYIEELREKARLFGKSGYATAGMEKAFNKSADTIENLLNELELYRAIGTIEEFKDLKEKSEPKKPYYVQYDGNPKIGNPHCSNCCGIINNGGTAKGMHCKWCGQKLDWSE